MSIDLPYAIEHNKGSSYGSNRYGNSDRASAFGTVNTKTVVRMARVITWVLKAPFFQRNAARLPDGMDVLVPQRAYKCRRQNNFHCARHYGLKHVDGIRQLPLWYWSWSQSGRECITSTEQKLNAKNGRPISCWNMARGDIMSQAMA